MGGQLQQLKVRIEGNENLEQLLGDVHGDTQKAAVLAKQMESNVAAASGGYQLVERIGAGSFGEVWRAQAPGGIFVAVKKIYRPVGSDADQQEKKALDHIKNLRHPYLLATHAYWVSDEGYLHVAMDLADHTLRDRLRECAKAGLPGVPTDELMRLITQAAKALDYVHSEGLFHRDIKPDNILIGKGGYAMIGDLGLVRKGETLGMGSTGAGTLPYMGPECFLGNVCKASDQYSLAITYLELRTRHRPFPPRANEFQVMLDARDGVPDLEGLEKPEQDVVARALAKNPEDRFPTCSAFVEALKTALQGEPVERPTLVPGIWPLDVAGPERHARRASKFWLWLVLLAMALAGVLWYILW
jgi:serine/threonine protein kinase